MQDQNIEHIIVGVDFSKYSKIAVKEAQKLAEVMNIPISYFYAYDYFQTLGETVSEFEDRMKKEIHKVYKLDEKSNVIVKLGDPAMAMIDYGKKTKKLPLLLVGHKGYSKMARFFLGSTAEKIATISPFPVWVHRGRRALLPKRVLVPSDFTEQTDRTLLRIKSFEDTIHPKLELYHVIPEPIPILDYPVYAAMSKRLLAEDDKTYAEFTKNHPGLKTVRGTGNVLTRIEKKSKGFDIIALSPRGKNKRDPLLGKVATKLVRSVNKPVLICP